ncbi:unnamed protein product, partial [Mesorhabditis belari]|uniref:Uncharacterized protein n=1 Tax=Mesorhabditis belari TaxID=2138241 RepID=A0AAF3FB04_9BILA
MDEKAKNGRLEREIKRVNDENAKMRQQLQVLTAENKEKELVQQKLFGQRKEYPWCEPDGQPQILLRFYIEYLEAKYKKPITKVPLDENEETA